MLDWNSRDRVEKEYRELFETRNYGTTVYSPLCAGFLCGKYNQGTLPDGSRGALWAADAKWNEDCTVWKFFAPQVVERTTKQLQGLAKIAADLGCTQA